MFNNKAHLTLTKSCGFVKNPKIECNHHSPITRAQGEAYVDHSNSLIITSEQYIETMKAKSAKKAEVERIKEAKQKEKEQ